MASQVKRVLKVVGLVVLLVALVIGGLAFAFRENIANLFAISTDFPEEPEASRPQYPTAAELRMKGLPADLAPKADQRSEPRDGSY